MDLSEPLEIQLVDSVHVFIGAAADPQTIRNLIGAMALMRIPPGLNGHRSAKWIVRHTLNLETPDVFVRLVRAVDSGQALPDLHALVDGLQQDPSTWVGGVGDGLWVPANWPFVDRASLRGLLDTMAGGGGPPALVIEGGFGQGKKTMGEYVEYLAQKTGSFTAAVVELRPQPDMLLEAATELYAALVMKPDPQTTHAEPERRATIHARALATAAASSPAPTWFVANVFDHGSLEKGVLAFVDELLRWVHASPTIGQKLRVLVLCDQFSLLGLQSAPPIEARHTLPSITEAEVRQWLEEAEPGKEALLYQATAATIMQVLEAENASPSSWLRRLSLQCKHAHKSLAGMVIV